MDTGSIFFPKSLISLLNNLDKPYNAKLSYHLDVNSVTRFLPLRNIAISDQTFWLLAN